MSMVAGDLALEVARLLNDAEPGHEFVRWHKSELIEYANDAATQITLWRADEFSQARTIDLQPGSRQVMPDGFMFFNRVIATIDQYGVEHGQPPLTDYRAARVASIWFEPACDTESGQPYVIQSYSIDSDDDHAFYVYPPVPVGAKVKAIVACVVLPEHVDAKTALPINAIYHNAVIEWMLYRAFSKDTESAADAMRATEHHSIFEQMMTTQRTLYNAFKEDRNDSR